MKTNILQSLIVIFVIIFPVTVTAQHEFKPGYVITLNGDTLKGLIDDKSSIASLHTCLFKKTKTQKAIEYNADDINEYRFENGRYFLSYRLIDKNYSKKIFFEYLLKGKIQLYRSLKNNKGNAYFIKKDSVFIPLDDSEVEYISDLGVHYSTQSQRFKGQLNYFMSDHPEM